MVDRFTIAKRNTAEIITEEELRKRIESNEKLRMYIGVEPSGRFHVGWLIWAYKLIDFESIGVKTIVLLADWHAYINDKLGGDRKKIYKFAHEYFAHTLKLCFKVLGGDPRKLTFVTGSNLYKENNNFWETVVEVSKNTIMAGQKTKFYVNVSVVDSSGNTTGYPDSSNLQVAIYNETGSRVTLEGNTDFGSIQDTDLDEINNSINEYILQPGIYTLYAYNNTHDSEGYNATLEVKAVDEAGNEGAQTIQVTRRK